MELWTKEHVHTLLPAVVVMAVLGLVLGRVLKGKDRAIRIIPLQVIGVLLVGMEIGKQIVSIRNGYDLYHLPFHFCSLFIFAIPVMAFYRGRQERKVAAVVASLCTAVFLLMMIYPNLIYSAENIRQFWTDYLSFHTVAFHNLVLFSFFLIIALRLYEPEPVGEGKLVLLFTLGFCGISASMAQLLKTNFNNFYSCNIGPLESVRKSVQGVLGMGLTQVIYVLVVSVLNILFMQLSHRLQRLSGKLTHRK